MATEITEVTGIGAQTAKALEEHGYQSAEDLAGATGQELLKVPGFGLARAEKVIAAAMRLVGTKGKKVQEAAPPPKKQKAPKPEKKKTVKKSKKKKSKKKEGKPAKKKAKSTKKKEKVKGAKKKKKSKKK